MNKDLTVGKPETVLWKFCLPLFGSIIFQQLYNIADSLVAGKFIGENALAAVGNGYEITLIFIAFAFGCNIGCSVVVSQLFGAKQYSSIKTAVYTTFIASGILCLTLVALGLLLCKSLLGWINTPDEIFADSRLYLNIYICGLPFLFYYNIATGIFSALGDSKTPFFFLACSSVANIAVDILFTAVVGMGVAGVALATFICQGISCILSIIVVIRRLASIHISGGQKPALFSVPIFKKIVVIAVPSILQQSFLSVGNILIQSVINSFGAGVIAGYSVDVKLNNLVTTSFTTLANGISNYTAQNIGAGLWERVKAGFRAGVKIVWVLCVPIVALYLIGGRMLFGFFMDNPSDAALSFGLHFLRTVVPFYFVISVKLVADGVLRGAERMKQFMAATFLDLFLRVILAFTLSGYFGANGIAYAWPVSWSVATVLSLVFYRRVSPKCKKE